MSVKCSQSTAESPCTYMTDAMKKSNRSMQELADRRQLILARRMVTRKRAVAACAFCKARKGKCNDYRPCARCRDLRLDACLQERGVPPSRGIVSHSSRLERSGSQEDGPKDSTMSKFTVLSVISSDVSASQSLLIPASSSGSTGAVPRHPHQVLHFSCPFASLFR